MKKVFIYIRKDGEFKNSDITIRGLNIREINQVLSHSYAENLRDEKLREQFVRDMKKKDIEVEIK